MDYSKIDNQHSTCRYNNERLSYNLIIVDQ